MKFPTPGTPVRGSQTGRPIMALLDLLGRRTALRILWELSKADLKFRPLQAAAETSPSVLNTRIAELREAGLVEAGPEGYRLTESGRELVRHFLPLVAWSEESGEEGAYKQCPRAGLTGFPDARALDARLLRCHSKPMETIQSRTGQGRVADAPSGHWVYRALPRGLWPYAQLARWDRSIGWQLLLLAVLVVGRTRGDRPCRAGDSRCRCCRRPGILFCS